jgi:hypothetical protein
VRGVTSPDQLHAPTDANAVAKTLARVETALRGDDRRPEILRTLGWEQQLAYRTLGAHADWLPTVLAKVPANVATIVQDNVTASSGLGGITPPQATLPDWKILTPKPADILRGYYDEAQRDFGIPWAYLAAIHFVETRMGRIHGNSTAGAQGPMQFIPSTWAAYGPGGNIDDDHDAIIAAGRHGPGAPGLQPQQRLRRRGGGLRPGHARRSSRVRRLLPVAGLLLDHFRRRTSPGGLRRRTVR